MNIYSHYHVSQTLNNMNKREINCHILGVNSLLLWNDNNMSAVHVLYELSGLRVAMFR